MKKALLLTVCILAVATVAPAQILVTNFDSPVVIDFDTTVSNVVLVVPGADERGMLEPNNWRVVWNWGRSLLSPTFSRNAQFLNLNGLGTEVAGYFIDTNNNGDLGGEWASESAPTLRVNPYGYTNNLVELSGNDDWAWNELYIRIQNTTGSTVSQWTIGFDVWTREDSENNRSTLYYEFAASNSLQPGALTYTEIGSHLMSNGGTTEALVYDTSVSTNISATVADGDYLVIKLRDAPTGPGSGIYIDNFSVTALSGAPPSDPYTQWTTHYGLSGADAAGDADPDGDGMINTNEFLAGFCPTNSAAFLRIVKTEKSGSDVVITYLGSNGDTNYPGGPVERTNVLEVATTTANGSFTNEFTTAVATNILTGGDGTGIISSMTDVGGANAGPGRYYRVRVLTP